MSTKESKRSVAMSQKAASRYSARSARCDRDAFLVIAALAALLLTTGTVVAQPSYELSETAPGPLHKPEPPLPPELNFSYDHASTAAEGYLRGASQLVHAKGSLLLSQAQARILNEQARWLYMHNRVEKTRSLYAQKELWREYRDRQRQIRKLRRAEGSAALAARQMSVYRIAYCVPPDSLDLETGKITWPVILLDTEFTDYRQRIDELFHRQVAYGDPQPDTALKLARDIERFKRAFRRHSRCFPRGEYLAAQKFLSGLKYEAQYLAEIG